MMLVRSLLCLMHLLRLSAIYNPAIPLIVCAFRTHRILLIIALHSINTSNPSGPTPNPHSTPILAPNLPSTPLILTLAIYLSPPPLFLSRAYNASPNVISVGNCNPLARPSSASWNVSGQWAASACVRELEDWGTDCVWLEVEGGSESSPGLIVHGDGYGGGR